VVHRFSSSLVPQIWQKTLSGGLMVLHLGQRSADAVVLRSSFSFSASWTLSQLLPYGAAPR
jgi:hypothetical protein